jgi:hypothetical protein
VLAPTEQMRHLGAGAQPAAGADRDDLTDGGTEQGVADADGRQRHALGLATDEGAQPGEDQEVSIAHHDLARYGRGQRRFDDGQVIAGPGRRAGALTSRTARVMEGGSGIISTTPGVGCESNGNRQGDVGSCPVTPVDAR